jgi:hypothetical protein
MLQNETDVERLESSGDPRMQGWERLGYASFDSITQPDCILPAQFFARRTAARVEGEMRLLIAVLEDAINTYLRRLMPRNNREREELAEVEAWFQTGGNGGLFAFENVCEVLGIEVSRLRDWIKSLRDGQVPARAAAAAKGARPDGGARSRRFYLGDRGRRTGGPRLRRPRRRKAKGAPSDPPRQAAQRDMLVAAN